MGCSPPSAAVGAVELAVEAPDEAAGRRSHLGESVSIALQETRALDTARSRLTSAAQERRNLNLFNATRPRASPHFPSETLALPKSSMKAMISLPSSLRSCIESVD